MNIVIRKLMLYEQRNQAEEAELKLNGYTTKPIDSKLRQNVKNILKQLNYSL